MTLKKFHIDTIPKIMFDYYLFNTSIGSGMHHLYSNGEHIYVDPTKYMALRTILQLKTLAEQSDLTKTNEIIYSIKQNMTRRLPW